MTACQAIPLDGQDHDGPIGAYVRICPAGHIRAGDSCQSCAGNGGVLCNDCNGPDSPAILIPATTFTAVSRPAARVAELERHHAAHIAERELMLADVGQLLDATGLGDHARPEPPHQVMLEAIEAARRHREHADQLDAEMARINLILSDNGYDYPHGARGVEDMASHRAEQLDELVRLDPEHWAAPGRAAGPYGARVRALEAALRDVLPRLVKTGDGYRARVSGTVLARWQAVADGQDGEPGE